MRKLGVSNDEQMKKKVLLVDDIKEFRSMIRILLSGNYDVVTAEDGEEAQSMMHRGLHPDVIITDLIMPRMDGYQLISYMKNDGKLKNIPIIVLSNVDKSDYKRNLKVNDICSYILKPFNASELKEYLQSALTRTFACCN